MKRKRTNWIVYFNSLCIWGVFFIKAKKIDKINGRIEMQGKGWAKSEQEMVVYDLGSV